MTTTRATTGCFASALSTAENWETAAEEVCQRAQAGLNGTANLAFLFVSPHFADDLAHIVDRVHAAIGCDALLGCTGESVIGGAREIESAPALSLWLASLGGTQIMPMHLEFERTAEGGIFTGWPPNLPETWPEGTAVILLGEPFSFPADELVRRLNEDHLGVPVLGGMASGGVAPGENRLLLGGKTYDSGALAVMLHGAAGVRSVVSQGCRPVGEPFVVTRAEANVIHELGGKPPLVRLQQVYETLSLQEQEMIRHGVHVGRVINEYQDEFKRGDFLVRNVIGADRSTGSIAIGDFVRAGQTVQFHVRDEQSADDDLRALLRRAKAGDKQQPCRRGALLFTCNGRGTRMFSSADHDAGCVRDELGEIPLAGFFAQGEIGPVGGVNFLHGFTASLALFEIESS